MSEADSATTAQPASQKVIVVSSVSLLTGILGLLGADVLHCAVPATHWSFALVAVVQHSSEIIASVGLVGLLLELFVRRELTTEILRRLRALFRIDRSVADALSTETRKDIVRTTLTAHLGDELGPAIFNGLVRRYFEDKNANRREAAYDITLREMTADRVITCPSGTMTFPASDYYEISAEYRFKRVLTVSPQKTIVCIFGDEWGKLIEKFKDKSCILREALPLKSPERNALTNAFKANAAGIDQLCAVSLKLNHQTVPVKPVAVDDNSIVFELDVKGVPENKCVQHEITVEGLVAKSARRFPVLVVEPTCMPVFTFTHPPTLPVSPVHLFTGAAPFDPEIDQKKDKIRITLGVDNPEEGWIFPNSGVLFTWV
jgi:hypothetical protein